jgi:hypothetical protein
MISCCCYKETYRRVDHVTVNVQPRALGVAPDGGWGGGGGAPAADNYGAVIDLKTPSK